MYPREFFDTYWRGDLRREVFVAISFADEFEKIREEAIKPAIEEDLDPTNPYRSNCLNASTISGSIHAEILDGLAHSTLVFADVSTMNTHPWKGQRNGNVMFELGIAQTVRPASDLVAVRSDDDTLAFDISHIRVHAYDRHDIPAARAKFAELLRDCLLQREKEKSLRSQILRERLDVDSMNLMVKVCVDGSVFAPFKMSEPRFTETDRRIAMRLLDLGVIRCVVTGQRDYQYVWTAFGKYCYLNPNLENIGVR
jgi:hypothetical protein